MRVLRFQAQDIKKLVVIDITPGTEPVVEITGNNEQGKSTILDCIRMAIGGKSEVSTQPLRRGKDKGKVTLDVGEDGKVIYRIITSFTKAGSYLRVESADGAIYKRPQELIDRFKNDFTIDPLRFANADPDVQRAMLMKAIKLAVTPSGIYERCGLNVTVDPANPLAAIDQAKKEIEGLRREVGRDLLREKGAAAAIVIAPEYEKTERIEATDVIAKKEELQGIKDSNRKEREKLESIRKSGLQLKEKRTALVERENEIEEQIKKLQEKLAALNAQVVETDAVIEAKRAEYESQKAVVDALQEPDMTELDRKIQDAERINRIVFQREQRETHLKAQGDHQERYDGYTTKLTALSSYREELLKGAEIPVPGLSIDEDGIVTYEGDPVGQRGKSMRIRIGLAVCAALNPQIRAVLVYDGNDIDPLGMQTIYDWAKEHDFQVWIEKIQTSGKGVSFVIVEGRVQEDVKASSDMAGENSESAR